MSQHPRHGGDIVANVLAAHGVPYVFTLCGGHISPLLVGAKDRGIGVIDTRDEKNAVFAADAVARMTGTVGVAAVTAGPGVTNAITALKNAQMAQTPMILFGGATATVLRGRGSLQDIDQLSLMRPATKWATRINTVTELKGTVEKALEVATRGIPGPVFLEVPVDLLYPEETVREWYLAESGVKGSDSLPMKALGMAMEAYIYKQFKVPPLRPNLPPPELTLPSRRPPAVEIDEVVAKLRQAKKPMLVVGNQTMVGQTREEAIALAESVRALGIPTFLAGSARGLLGRRDELQLRHKRSKAMKEADLCIIAGFPFDFRLKYGRGFGKHTEVVAANLSAQELRKNRRPEIALRMHPAEFLRTLARRGAAARNIEPWFESLRKREADRDAEIAAKSRPESELVDPVHFFLRLEEKMADDSILAVDGGDFVATGAYILRPRSPLSWLDPGVFGTLGVGGGFALGATLVRPESEVWLIYGDGSSAYSLNEFDTFARHGCAPIAVIGTDASWAQIARDQIVVLGDAVGTELVRNDYHKVAEGYGGVGLLLDDPAKIDEVLEQAKAHAREGKPVCINVHIAKSDFREGSISI